MSCPKCVRDPFAHSFHFFGKADDKSLFYTAPARATARDTNDSLLTLKRHLDEIDGPWIWVIDCANMELHNFYTAQFSVAFTDILIREHSKNLKHVLIVNPNVWIYRVLHTLRDDIFRKVRIATKGIELSNVCSEFGFTAEARTWLQIAFTKSPNQRLD